ncbi:MAG: cation-efflux pump [Chloroflexota bacterium]
MADTLQGTKKLRTLKMSAIAISSVVIIEAIIGLIVNSLAVLSDGLHALLDVFSTLMLFFAARASIKPPDEEHTYGHEKFEAIGGLIAGIILVAVALLVFYEAAIRLLGNVPVIEGLELAGFFAIGYTLFIDFFRITIFRSAGSTHSTSVRAGFYDAISDLSSTVIALLGFGLATLGFNNGDSLASIFLGSMLIYLSIKLTRTSITELSDATSKDMAQKIRKAILSEHGVLRNERLRTRQAGSKTFIETTVIVSDAMSLDEAHALASRIEAKLEKMFGTVDSTIHIEPSESTMGMRQRVEKLAKIEGVKEVHEISTVYVTGKLYITLHVIVDPKLSVEEAHNIAERIEKNMYSTIKQLEHVTVHVEPFGELPSVEIGDEQLKSIIANVTDGFAENLRVDKVLTYMAGEKRYINLDCCFTKQITIAEAHELASRIEKEVKERFTNSAVTVHIEPICT